MAGVLPDSWKTRDLWPNEVARILFREVGPLASACLFDVVTPVGIVPMWHVVRFHSRDDEFMQTPRGVQPRPHLRRRMDVLAQGRTLDEAIWYLRRAQGSGRVVYTPVLAPRGQIAGFKVAGGAVEIGPELPKLDADG